MNGLSESPALRTAELVVLLHSLRFQNWSATEEAYWIELVKTVFVTPEDFRNLQARLGVAA